MAQLELMVKRYRNSPSIILWSMGNEEWVLQSSPHGPRVIEINADGEDVAVVRVEVLDNEGRAIPTADPTISFKVSGEGALIGVGNGDPNCQESDKAPKRSLFNGLAQVIVQSSKIAGTIAIEDTAAIKRPAIRRHSN